MADDVTVTQADRDAAAKFYRKYLHREGEVLVADHMQAGKIDESPLVQAFALHRQAAQDSDVMRLIAEHVTDDLIAGIGRGEIKAQGQVMDLLEALRAALGESA